MPELLKKVRALISNYGGKFSTELEIDLSSRRSAELFKWFMASLLFGARISVEIAERTYRVFEKAGVTTPRAILETGWGGMIPILGRGGYARYDNRTANKLLGVARKLVDEYDGDMLKLIESSKSPEELVMRLTAFKGVGEVTANIFLRELRGIFPQTEPPLGPRAHKAALELGYATSEDPMKALEELKGLWKQTGITKYDFADFEAALTRIRS